MNGEVVSAAQHDEYGGAGSKLTGVMPDRGEPDLSAVE